MITKRQQAHGLGEWKTEHKKFKNLCGTVNRDG
jgi:hypothetical protein